MWYESDLDALMSRTCLRPIPTGKVKKNQALVLWCGTFNSFSVIALDAFIASNLISASLLLFVNYWFLFFDLYNLVKEKNSTKYCNRWSRRSFTTSYWLDYSYWKFISIEPNTFSFLIIFFWTPSHFWALKSYINQMTIKKLKFQCFH